MAGQSESRTFHRLLYELREEHERALRACQIGTAYGESSVSLPVAKQRSLSRSRRSSGSRSIRSTGMSVRYEYGSENISRVTSVNRLWNFAARSNTDEFSPRLVDHDGATSPQKEAADAIDSVKLGGAKVVAKNSVKSADCVAHGSTLADEQTCIVASSIPHAVTLPNDPPHVGTKSSDNRMVSQHGSVSSTASPKKKKILNNTNSWSALGDEMRKVATFKRSSQNTDRVSVARISKLSILTDGSVAAAKISVMRALSVMRESKHFENACGGAIVFNCIVLGILAQYSSHDHKYTDSPPLILDALDKACSVWFLIELLVRLSGGWRRFFCGSLRFWNVFDFVLVTVDMMDNVVQIIWGRAGSPVKNFVVLRALRIFRVLRVIRLLQFFRDLHQMIQSIRMCGKSLLWALVLVCLIIYLFAMYFMQQVTDFLVDSPSDNLSDKLTEQWGSIYASSYTLYMVMSGGVSWKDVSEPLLDMHWIHGLVLFFYVFFTLFVVTNIITSIFVDTALQSTAQDREEVIQRKLRERDVLLAQMTNIFEEADDGSGLVSFETFQRHMHDQRVRAYLRSVELDVTEARSLFSLLDTDGSGDINIKEFVFGCMRLKGAARSIDLAILMHDSRLMHELLDDIRETQLAHSWELENLQSGLRHLRRVTPESLRSQDCQRSQDCYVSQDAESEKLVKPLQFPLKL